MVTSLFADSVSLALVLGHAGVDRANDIRANASLEDSRERDGASNLALLRVNVDKWTGRLQKRVKRETKEI